MSACPVTSGLTLLLRADTGVTIDGSNRVSNWANQVSPGVGDFSQATDANKPVLIANAFCGRPGIYFDGVDDFFESLFTGAQLFGADVGEVFITMRHTAMGTGTATATCRGVFGPVSGFNFQCFLTSAVICMGSGRSGTWGAGLPQITEDVENACQLWGQVVPPSTAGYLTKDINIVSKDASTNASSGAFDNTKVFRVGQISGALCFQGYIESIVCFNRALSNKERTQVNRWMRADFYTPPAVYYVDQVNGSNANSGRKQSAAWKDYEYAIDQPMNGPGSVIALRRAQVHLPAATVGPALNGSATDRRTLTMWERPAITGLTGNFTNGSNRLVTNVSGASLAKLAHAARYITAPDGRKYLIKFIASTSSFYINRNYKGPTVVGGSFQINADDNYSWMSLLGALDGADQKTTWDADAHTVPTAQTPVAAGVIYLWTSSTTGYHWAVRHIYFLWAVGSTGTATGTVLSVYGNIFEHCIIEAEQNKYLLALGSGSARACLFIGSNAISHTSNHGFLCTDRAITIDCCWLYCFGDIGQLISTAAYIGLQTHINPDFGSDHPSASLRLMTLSVNAYDWYAVEIINPLFGVGYTIMPAIAASITLTHRFSKISIANLNEVKDANLIMYPWFGQLQRVTSGASLRTANLDWYLEFRPSLANAPTYKRGRLSDVASVENVESNAHKLFEFNTTMPTGSKEYRVYINSEDFIGSQRMLVLEGTYYDADGQRVFIRSTQDIEVRTSVNDWSQYMSVTINAKAGTVITLILWCAYYDASLGFYIDPYIDGLGIVPVFNFGFPVSCTTYQTQDSLRLDYLTPATITNGGGSTRVDVYGKGFSIPAALTTATLGGASIFSLITVDSDTQFHFTVPVKADAEYDLVIGRANGETVTMTKALAYLNELERNKFNTGTTVADLAAGKSVKIANVDNVGTNDKVLTLVEEASRNTADYTKYLKNATFLLHNEIKTGTLNPSGGGSKLLLMKS